MKKAHRHFVEYVI